MSRYPGEMRDAVVLKSGNESFLNDFLNLLTRHQGRPRHQESGTPEEAGLRGVQRQGGHDQLYRVRTFSLFHPWEKFSSILNRSLMGFSEVFKITYPNQISNYKLFQKFKLKLTHGRLRQTCNYSSCFSFRKH